MHSAVRAETREFLDQDLKPFIEQALAGAKPAPVVVAAKQAADMLAVSTRTLSRMVEAGLLSPIDDGFDTVRFTVAEIERYAAQHTGGAA